MAKVENISNRGPEYLALDSKFSSRFFIIIQMCSAHNQQGLDSNYQFGDYVLNRVNDHKGLGVIIDNKLMFAKHIDAITSKTTAALGFIRRFCHDITDTQTLKLLFYAMHLSKLTWPFDKIYTESIHDIRPQKNTHLQPKITKLHRMTSV